MKQILIGLTVFIGSTLMTQYLALQRHRINEELLIKKTSQEASAVKDRLKTDLSYSLSATKTLAFLVENYGEPTDFDKTAKTIIGSTKYIDALELTHHGTITHVYPLEGNEAAIGFDVLRDTTINREAFKAIEKKDLFFAGPVKLKQGGIAIIGRLPIFVDKNFYGFSVVLIKLSTLVKMIVSDTTEKEFTYQLSKINPNTHKEEFFLPGPVPANKQQFVFVEVPDGAWKLYVIPKQNPVSWHAITFPLVGLLLSIIAGLFAWSLARQPEKLSRLVEQKTRELAASEKYFRSLIEKSSEAIVLIDSAGKVLYQSPSTDRISGYTLQEIQSIDGIELIHPDDRDEASAAFQKLLQSPGRTLNRNHRLLQKNGNYIWLEGTYSNLLEDEHIKAIVYNYHDVTDRVEAEQKLLKVSKEIETTLNRINDSVVSLDREARYTYLNDAALATHPLGREGTIGKKITEVHPEIQDTVFWEMFQKASNTQTVQETEGYYTTMDTWFLAKAYPSHDGLTIFYHDITLRKKAEQEIVEEKNLSASIINSLPGVFYLYDRDGKFIRWNQNFETISGYSSKEIAGMHPLQFFPEDEQALLKERINDVFVHNHAEVRAHFYTKDKRRIPYYFNGHRVYFNNVEYLIGMGIDITDQTEAEQALRARADEIQKLTAHLEQIREEERTRIAMEIHDELGQQLTGLKMDASWIGKKINHDDAMIKEKLSGMILLIDETVKTVRRISSELRPGILDDLGLIPALEWHCQEFEKRTHIKTDFKCGLHDLNPDKNTAINIFRIYQEALTNIARHAQATLVQTHLAANDENIVLTIQDNGIGFDRAEAKMKKSLGLIGMRERALTFHGELSITSEINKGTVVVLKIPINKF